MPPSTAQTFPGSEVGAPWDCALGHLTPLGCALPPVEDPEK